jgi:hypothetical protein
MVVEHRGRTIPPGCFSPAGNFSSAAFAVPAEFLKPKKALGKPFAGPALEALNVSELV